MWTDRFRQDFHLALVVILPIVMSVAVLPFAVYRFFAGQPLSGSIDLLIIACACGGAQHAYRHGSTARVALFLAVTSSVGCVIVAYVVGPVGPLWMHGVMLTNFMLVERKRAVAISFISIAAVAASSSALPDLTHKAAFVGSSLVVCAFAYVFMWRTDLQRKQLENLALIDPLTGASNRRGMNAELEIAMATSSRNGKPLGLIVFDLDHFKRINDRYGHEAGDSVLIQVANAVRGTTRKNDRFFRLGGEEFALLIPDTDPSTLRDIAEKIRLTIQSEVRCGDTAITISLGGGILRNGEMTDDWRARVDAAMYRAKNQGRNRTVIDELVSADKPVAIRPATIPKASAGTCAEKSTRMQSDFDMASTMESLVAPPPKTFSAWRPHNGQLMADPNLSVSLGALAGNYPGKGN